MIAGVLKKYGEWFKIYYSEKDIATEPLKIPVLAWLTLIVLTPSEAVLRVLPCECL